MVFSEGSIKPKIKVPGYISNNSMEFIAQDFSLIFHIKPLLINLIHGIATFAFHQVKLRINSET